MHGRMPYLTVSTNAEVSAEAAASFLKEASKAVAEGAGKPEQYVMVKVAGGETLLFAGSNTPAAFMEMKSIGFPAQGVQALAGSLTDLVTKHLGVPKSRVFVVFTDVKAPMWGLNGETFG
jgi:phenylpyruvate tautomerase PptA (4-oxalocrotonate tautomerase family)